MGPGGCHPRYGANSGRWAPTFSRRLEYPRREKPDRSGDRPYALRPRPSESVSDQQRLLVEQLQRHLDRALEQQPEARRVAGVADVERAAVAEPNLGAAVAVGDRPRRRRP